MRVTRSCVSCREEPPAPYVTETNDGPTRSRLRRVSYSWFAALSVLGGKNSKEQVLGDAAKMSTMCICSVVHTPSGRGRSRVLSGGGAEGTPRWAEGGRDARRHAPRSALHVRRYMSGMTRPAWQRGRHRRAPATLRP